MHTSKPYSQLSDVKNTSNTFIFVYLYNNFINWNIKCSISSKIFKT